MVFHLEKKVPNVEKVQQGMYSKEWKNASVHLDTGSVGVYWLFLYVHSNIYEDIKILIWKRGLYCMRLYRIAEGKIITLKFLKL